jgi:hypothetical protein
MNAPGACAKQTSVTAGTLIRGRRFTLTVWFWVAT